MELSSRQDVDRVWITALCVGLSPLLIDEVGVVPFVPAYVTVFAWVIASGFHLRWPLLNELAYSVAMFALAIVGVVGLVTLVILGQSWLALTTGVVVSAVCLSAFRARPGARSR